MRYDWPGNVRELENEVQRAVIQADGESLRHARAAERPRAQQRRQNAPSKRPAELDAVDEADDATRHAARNDGSRRKAHLGPYARAHGNNKTSAAKALGITREGLHKKLKGLGM